MDRSFAAYAPALQPFAGALSAVALTRAAEAATGLSDWGGERWGEAAFRERLEFVCRGLDREVGLDARGRGRVHSRLHVMLCSRLRQVAWRAGQPEGAPIVAPLLGTGLGRTGTTFLHTLLAQDPENLSATAAHAGIPVPPPAIAAAAREAERTGLYQRILDFQGFTAPDVTEIHPYAADMPEECVFLQEASCAVMYGTFFNVPGFAQVADAGAADAYAWQKGMMQTLQEGRAFERWLLKAPGHVKAWDTMVAAFPDARVFINHRDPGRVMASVASLTMKLQSLCLEREVDPRTVGPGLIKTWAALMDHVTAWRAAHPEMTVVDVHYAQLIADPIGEAERVYAAFGLTLSGEAKTRMERFLKTDRHGKGPARRYSLADYGLDEAMIEEAFAPYIDHYGIAREKRV
jgi:hypothetical protein